MKLIIERTDGPVNARDIAQSVLRTTGAVAVAVVVMMENGGHGNVQYNGARKGVMPRALRELARITQKGEAKL